MRERIKANFAIAAEAVMANRVRSFLTALGIIFGVAAVIAMMAIGNGAQQEILEQIKLVGVNNIVIEPVLEQSEEDITEGGEDEGGSNKPEFSPGLSMQDVQSILNIVPGIDKMSPEVMVDTYVINNGLRRTSKLVGVTPSFFNVSNLPLSSGRMFNDDQLERGLPVCIIGSGVKAKFFPQEDPIGKILKCGPHWLEVVGVLQERRVSQAAIDNLGIRDYNMDVYTPIKTMLIRFRNRAKITEDMLGGGGFGGGGRVIFIGGGNEEEQSPDAQNYHQLDRLVVQVAQTENLSNTAEVISRMLSRRHYGVVDYQITIPIQLLEQQQRTNDIFNYVLAAIAAISLLVGGIGIMNIMLASVLERIKEIGLRLAIGAKKDDIVMQFVLESVMISISGGIIGILLGVGLATMVSNLADIPTVISFVSILVSFGVAAFVGLFFGIFPARRAAQQDPITSLRYE